MRLAEHIREKRKLIINILFWIYVAVVFRITVFRTGFTFSHFFENGRLNLTLFQGYLPMIKEGRWFMFIYLFAGNIIWFVPLGMYLEGQKKWKLVATVLCGFLFSLTIETLQYAFGTGFSELDDLILNTFGVFLGALSVRGYRSVSAYKK